MIVDFMKPDITEAEVAAVAEVLRSGWLTTGPVTKEFEKELADFIGCKRTATFNSQTMAAELCLRLLDIGPGDEVIVPAYTYSASCSIVYHVGANPVMLDCGPNNFEMDYVKLEEAITPRTKAVIPVDLGGVVCDYETIEDILEANKNRFLASNAYQEAIGRVAILADTAHSLGAERKGRKAGNIADFSNFSFHAVKNLTTAEGGAMSWRQRSGFDDDEIYRELMLLSLHGQSKDALSKSQAGDWEYDIVAPLYKCNLTDIASAIGLSQLRRYEAMLRRRKTIVDFYNDAFCHDPVSWLVHDGDDFSSSKHLYLLRLEGYSENDRNDFIRRVANRGVSLNVHYKPLPMLTAYKNRGFDPADYPRAYSMYANLVTLPLYSTMTDSEVEYVVDCVKGEL